MPLVRGKNSKKNTDLPHEVQRTLSAATKNTKAGTKESLKAKNRREGDKANKIERASNRIATAIRRSQPIRYVVTINLPSLRLTVRQMCRTDRDDTDLPCRRLADEPSARVIYGPAQNGDSHQLMDGPRLLIFK